MKPSNEDRTMRAAAKPARAEWTGKIEALRQKLGMSQAALARALGVSPMAVSRWERGINEPTASMNIQLGKLAGNPDCWYFWSRAGLTREDVERALGL